MNAKRMQHILSIALTALYIALAVWIAASWGEVISKNSKAGGNYSEYNIFKIITELK